jgi:uroporphyrinogen decarboxylase
LARDLLRDPALAHRLLKVSLDAALALTDALSSVGAVPVLVDPVASGSVLSPKLFRAFAAPYIEPLHARIRALGWPPILHICGKTHLLLEAMADLAPAALSLDRADLGEARRRIGARTCLMGNVTPTETLLNGSPDDVDREAKACLDAAGDSPGGFILASGCEVPVDTPPENIRALMRAADQYGARN